MKSIQDLFSIAKHSDYKNLEIYAIYDGLVLPICKIWSRERTDVRLEADGDNVAYSLSDISQFFCENNRISREEEIVVHFDKQILLVKDIAINFQNGQIFLMLKGYFEK